MNKEAKMIKIAITGNIASGKSQAEKIISDSGYIVFDADKIAHEILDNITDFYGYDVFTNGKIDRKKLGFLVFSDNELKTKLEEIIHPKVKQKILEIFEKYENEDSVFVSVPLLFEADFESLFDKIILIAADTDIRLERLMKRNNLTKSEALKRINSQFTQEEKIKKSDYVIYNNSSLVELEKQVKEFLHQL